MENRIQLVLKSAHLQLSIHSSLRSHKLNRNFSRKRHPARTFG